MIRLNNEDFIKRAKLIHNKKYDYSKVIYVNRVEHVDIICPIHGTFKKKPTHHLRGQGCPRCSVERTANSQRKTLSQFVEESNKTHNNKYDYSKVNYINNRTKVQIICPLHGEFEQLPGNHLKGKGCKYCAPNKPMDTKIFIDKSKILFGDYYTYEKVLYVKSSEKVKITCQKHGDFDITPNNHLIKRQGCPRCNRVIDTTSFIEKSKKRFNKKFTYENTEYISMKNNCTINCEIHGDINVTPLYHLNSQFGCKKCSNSNSVSETELSDFLNENDVTHKIKDREILEGKELDIYIPKYNLAIELNGLYWHSSEFLDKNYHMNKTEKCLSKNINLIHIFEDEWVNKKDIIKSMIKHRLFLSEKKIFARKCEIKIVPKKEKRVFLNENHLQGDCPTTTDIGLYYKNNLISIMSFGRRGILKNKSIELIRFCNKLNTSVIGSFGRLLKFYIKQYKIDNIVSYCDRRWGEGDVYVKNGFKLVKNTVPNYFYIINKNRESRYKYQKHKLNIMGLGDCGTEEEIMNNNGYYRIYDSGNKKYELLI
jgi:uncharacterized protein with PIN domain